MASVGGNGWSSGRRELPRALAVGLVLVYALFAFTLLGGVGMLLTAASYDLLDGRVLAVAAYAAAPGVLGAWLARRSWEGGVRVWWALAGVQVWLVLGAFSNLAGGSARGFSQLFLPVLVLYFLTRAESREWYRLAAYDRRERRPFSLPRMIRWRREDDGQTAVEYAGLVAVVVAVIGALVLSGLGTQVYGGIQAQVCKVTGVACPAPPGEGDDDGPVNAGDGGGDRSSDSNGDTHTGPHGFDPADPISAADEIDEPPYQEPPSDDGDGCFSGVGAFFGCAGDQLKQVGQGLFVDGIWGDVTGIWDVVTHPVDTWNGLMDYGRSLGDEWYESTADAREKWDDGDYVGAILDWGGASLGTGGTVLFDSFIGDDVVEQWDSGNETRAVTTVLWNVGSLFIPGYGEAKIAEKVGSLGRLSKIVDDAAEAAEDARRAARAGDLDALEDAARRADEAADAAEDAARRSGCVIAAPPARTPYEPPLSGGPGTGITVLAAAQARVPYGVRAEGGCDEEAREQARQAREQERLAYLERKRAEEPGRAERALENRKEWPPPQHGDTGDPRNYDPPAWAEGLPTRTYGDADGGDGFWAGRDRNPEPNWRNESWLRYQEQVTGTQRGYEYVVPHPDPDVPDVEFDGWDSARGTYLEAKNGYDSFLTVDRTELTPSGRERLLTEARRQVEAARGKDVEWHFSNEEVADAARDAFEDAGLDIEVVHTRPEPTGGDRKPEAFDD
ncbi:Tox-REase-5 domain-containing protein [Streptomyces sp. B93]|uniref:Tox-REase-5 domain-containing protein n=1 Tax=Streptomyces sp. B93 TaxID=2824875 RepID=UPI001B385518|nr:Tox-REase-5 domain-containing protein [Streptomyces sp. B93]MBQ1094071.1 restriction endonuclease fold toxin 5 domain-containing protein [Streptomyces sp. B93]